jgi:uncharacterized lipoprotein YddW (UPF0748 family)
MKSIPKRGAFFLLALSFLGNSLQASELKGAWLTRFYWDNPVKVDSLLQMAANAGLTDVFVQIRGRGEAFYRSSYEPIAAPFAKNDQLLNDLLVKARLMGIRIHAWVNVFLVGSDLHQPFPEKHILSKHPEWVLKDANLLSLLKYKHQDYSRLQLEGIYINPMSEEVQAYTLKIIKDIFSKYPFDGLHLDYFRLPSPRFYTGSLSSGAMLKKSLTVFLRNIKAEVRKQRGSVILSVAVKANLTDAGMMFGQYWDHWLDQRAVDYAVPMNYSSDNNTFISNIQTFPEKHYDKIIVGLSLFNSERENQAFQLRLLKENGIKKYAFYSLNYLVIKLGKGN